MSKNIVICCDGTANSYGLNNSNVAKLYDMLPISAQQVDFYDPGVGTTPNLGIKIWGILKNIFSQATGLDLAINVQEAYIFLMSSYELGDKIFLFGYSRGAHTVRRLADILGKYGLLHQGSPHLVPYVIDMYNNKNIDDKIIQDFRSKFTSSCPVHFLGVWDTVSSLSKILNNPTLDGALHSETANAFHAVAIDEKRYKFPANLFDMNLVGAHQNVEEVWFAGIHSDVGGTQADSTLANIPLFWLLQKARALGLHADDEMHNSIKIDALAPAHKSWRGVFIFLPWPAYFLFLSCVLFSLQKMLALSVPAYVYGLLLLSSLVSIYFTKKSRQIPSGAKVHRSVLRRIEKLNERPPNLMPLVEKKEITWVD